MSDFCRQKSDICKMIDFFHVFNRGAHKAKIFENPTDYWRFLYILYIGNDTAPFLMRDHNELNVFTLQRKEPLVDIVAYCLMPNHYHLLFRETAPGNKTKFMRKIMTGYTNFYNIKYNHSGTILQGKYKYKIVDTAEYFKTVINYIHLNPYGLVSPDLSKEFFTEIEHISKAKQYSSKYEYSSYQKYLGKKRIQDILLADVGLLSAEVRHLLAHLPKL